MGTHLKDLLRQGKLARVFGLGQLCHPKLIEMIGLHGGFDAVWLDQEHAGLSIEQIEKAARAARVCGLDSFVRLAPTDYATVMRPLEAGAGGIMADHGPQRSSNRRNRPVGQVPSAGCAASTAPAPMDISASSRSLITSAGPMPNRSSPFKSNASKRWKKWRKSRQSKTWTCSSSARPI